MFGGTNRSRGQALTEYILLLAIVVTLLVGVTKAIRDLDLNKELNGFITEDFKRAYQYGHPEAKGFDEPGGPENHPRFAIGRKNFRIFINPSRR